jgi:hypothetical protein
MLQFKSIKSGIGNAFELAANLGWLRWGRRDKPKENLTTPAAGSRNQKSPTTDWARAVAMLAAMKKQREMESKRDLH